MFENLKDSAARALARANARALNLHADTDGELSAFRQLKPYVTGRRYGFAHYNVVIPDLPEPHRYLGCAVLIGRSGAAVFDIDHATADSPRHTATIALGTAATAPSWFLEYSTRTDCDLAPDGSRLNFGGDLSIVGDYPTYDVVVDRPDFHLELSARCTPQMTRFVRSPVYDHIGFPATYDGTLTWQGETQAISGVMSFEYARLTTLTGFRDRIVSRRLKIPWHFFSYQVIKIKPDTLLILSSVEAWGAPLLTSAYVKQINGKSERHLRNVSYDILSYREQPAVAPDGAEMKIPHEFRWRIAGEDGTVATEINGTTDTELIYGLGRGWIGGYSYEGRFEGEPVSGSGYLEHVRTRKEQPRRNGKAAV